VLIYCNSGFLNKALMLHNGASVKNVQIAMVRYVVPELPPACSCVVCPLILLALSNVSYSL
jgi:hypothetical protein